jgi:import inner membrane translocase subunit TIM22
MDPFKRYPCQIPIWAPGKEPLPPGFTEEDRAAIAGQQKYANIAAMAMESCATKTVMAGTMGEPPDFFFTLVLFDGQKC